MAASRQALGWEADVVLSDGGIARLRSLVPADREALISFYTRVSERAKYLRFFGTHPRLSEQELDHYTEAEQHDRVVLGLFRDDELIAFGHYEVVPQLLPTRVGNVAFLVQDDAQGRGVGNILLEHLAQIGRENGVERFTAEMLTENRRMATVFSHAGYHVRPALADGCIVVDFALDPTAESRSVLEQREHKAESNAIRRLLEPRRVAVVGEGRTTVGVVEALVQGGFAGELVALTSGAGERAATPLRQLPGAVDLIVARSDPDGLEELIAAAAEKDARGVVALAGATTTPLAGHEAAQVVAWARSHGLRALGPAALGLVNTDPRIALNASGARMPRRGTVGLFAQSAGVATIVLSQALHLDLGLSNVVATGSYADVSANDVMQFWADDDRTDVCVLSLDAVGNRRKFFRVLRRLALAKPVVVFTPSRALRSHASGDAALPLAPARALDQVIGDAGAIVVDRRETMFDVAQLLARQPLPAGPRVLGITNSSGLAEQMMAAARRFGLDPAESQVLHGDDPLAELRALTAQALADKGIDAVVACLVEVADPLLEPARTVLAELAAAAGRAPLLGVFVGFAPLPSPSAEPDGRGQLPCYTNYADAFQALGLALENARRRERRRPRPDDEIYAGSAPDAWPLVDGAIAVAPHGADLDAEAVASLLTAYGVGIERRADTADGIRVRIRATEDAAVGPLVEIGLAGPPSELLGDLAWAVPPLRRSDARAMIDALGTAPLLHGVQHPEPALSALEDVLMRLAALTDDLPPVTEVVADVVVGAGAARVVAVGVRVDPLPHEREPLARRAT